LAVAESPNFDAVCFHSQQCIEKLMKALLIARGAAVSKTHDLAEVGRLLGVAGEELPGGLEELRFLSLAAVTFRYPGESADREIAARAYEISSRLRQGLLSRLNNQI
jgi:HEPN domain-containing protein